MSHHHVRHIDPFVNFIYRRAFILFPCLCSRTLSDWEPPTDIIEKRSAQSEFRSSSEQIQPFAPPNRKVKYMEVTSIFEHGRRLSKAL